MNPTVIKVDVSREYFFVEGCYILELSNSDRDPAVSIARARVKPGVTTKLHQLGGIVERYVILSGQGRVRIGDDIRAEVSAGDVVLIPEKCSQQVSNIGSDDLVFLAICSPRFELSSYQDMSK